MDRNGAAHGRSNCERRRKWHRSDRGAFGSPQQASNPPFPSNSDPNHPIPTTEQLHANRDTFHFLFRQVDDALIARERFLLMKEEEIGRREHEIYRQECLIESLKEEVAKWKEEASYYAEKYFFLRNRVGCQNTETNDQKGESSVAHHSIETVLPVSEDHSRGNPSTFQIEKGACSGNPVEEKMNDPVRLSSPKVDEKDLSVNIAETDRRNCFDHWNAANEQNSHTNSQLAPCNENTKSNDRDIVMTKEHPSPKLQISNDAGSNKTSALQFDATFVNGEIGMNSSVKVLPMLPVKVKIELYESGPIDACDSVLDRHVVAENSSGLDCSEKALGPHFELGDSIVRTVKNVHDNHNGAAAFSFDPVEVKIENVESDPIITVTSGLELLDSPMQHDMPLSIKSENFEDFDTDALDHISLHERAKLLLSKKLQPSCISTDVLSSESVLPLKVDSSNLLDAGARGLNRRKKRTATTSVKTALEEDAPGLLQILLEKGLRVDEIKLYGDMQNDDGLYRDSVDENFNELETVISKLFSRPAMLLKLAKIFHKKGSKTGYCLACLVSLIEQARCLQFNKWSVEWGWCRDLYSFIFVFERHNRIVLERPEYGYATYFFELLPSLPTDWQIRRLIIAMKLVSCSRSTLLEDKPFVVGEDLSEDEARILEEYGWSPNTGLGTMLNYCDRVVHDYRTEDTNEWRTKIGKMLMNGYDQGAVWSHCVPKKVLALKPALSSQLKLEF